MRLADLPRVLAIQSECYTEVAPECEESVRAKLVASPNTCFVALAGAQILAYLIALPWNKEAPPPLDARSCELPTNPNTLYLHDLAVSPCARGTGAGKLLVTHFLEQARRLKLPRCNLIAVQNSESYWSRFGFKTIDTNAELSAKLATYGMGAK